MLYLGFLQEGTIHVVPTNLLTWKLNEDLVKKTCTQCHQHDYPLCSGNSLSSKFFCCGEHNT